MTNCGRNKESIHSRRNTTPSQFTEALEAEDQVTEISAWDVLPPVSRNEDKEKRHEDDFVWMATDERNGRS